MDKLRSLALASDVSDIVFPYFFPEKFKQEQTGKLHCFAISWEQTETSARGRQLYLKRNVDFFYQLHTRFVVVQVFTIFPAMVGLGIYLEGVLSFNYFLLSTAAIIFVFLLWIGRALLIRSALEEMGGG